MSKRLFNGFKLIIGVSITVLGTLTYFLTGNMLNILYPMLSKINDPAIYRNTVMEINAFSAAHAYSTILVIVGIILCVDALLRLFLLDLYAPPSEK
ncbi:MAG: hypothetical protein ACE5PM_02810 [Candidatus Hydrothermarchaeales archaeon]